jgi:hypothetical protein
MKTSLDNCDGLAAPKEHVQNMRSSLELTQYERYSLQPLEDLHVLGITTWN